MGMPVLFADFIYGSSEHRTL